MPSPLGILKVQCAVLEGQLKASPRETQLRSALGGNQRPSPVEFHNSDGTKVITGMQGFNYWSDFQFATHDLVTLPQTQWELYAKMSWRLRIGAGDISGVFSSYPVGEVPHSSNGQPGIIDVNGTIYGGPDWSWGVMASASFAAGQKVAPNFVPGYEPFDVPVGYGFCPYFAGEKVATSNTEWDINDATDPAYNPMEWSGSMDGLIDCEPKFDRLYNDVYGHLWPIGGTPFSLTYNDYSWVAGGRQGSFYRDVSGADPLSWDGAPMFSDGGGPLGFTGWQVNNDNTLYISRGRMKNPIGEAPLPYTMIRIQEGYIVTTPGPLQGGAARRVSFVSNGILPANSWVEAPWVGSVPFPIAVITPDPASGIPPWGVVIDGIWIAPGDAMDWLYGQGFHNGYGDYPQAT